MANWDLVRIFLEVARTGSFRAAAGQLNMSAFPQQADFGAAGPH
jgi:regulatory helix-turn-helix LysR family protein